MVDESRKLIGDRSAADGADDGFLLPEFVEGACRNRARHKKYLRGIGNTPDPVEFAQVVFDGRIAHGLSRHGAFQRRYDRQPVGFGDIAGIVDRSRAARAGHEYRQDLWIAWNVPAECVRKR
jgi:hypothetical protein